MCALIISQAYPCAQLSREVLQGADRVALDQEHGSGQTLLQLAEIDWVVFKTWLKEKKIH